jgi:hypothetical protein
MGQAFVNWRQSSLFLSLLQAICARCHKLLKRPMKKITALLPILLLSLPAMAVLGPKFNEHERPHSICAIEFYSERNPSLVDEICSVVIVDQNWGLTAGHCVDKLPERDHRVLCRDQVTTTIDQVLINPLLKLEELRFEELAHQNDSALVRFSHPVTTPPLPFVKSRQERLELVEEASVCGIFGHGGFRETLRHAGYSTQARINPSQLEFEENLIRIRGIGGINSGLVEPGDSGGSLACKNKNEEWVHLAQVSGRNFKYFSFFAPTDVIAPYIDDIVFDPATQDTATRERWLDEDLRRDLQFCERNYKRLMDEEFIATLPLDQAKMECEHEMLQDAIARYDSGESVVAKLKPFTLVQLTQNEQSIRSQNTLHIQRYLTGPNPFSITDHAYTQLTITSIDLENQTARGVLRAFGGPDYFACLENVICDSGEFDGVVIALEDLYFDRR